MPLFPNVSGTNHAMDWQREEGYAAHFSTVVGIQKEWSVSLTEKVRHSAAAD